MTLKKKSSINVVLGLLLLAIFGIAAIKAGQFHTVNVQEGAVGVKRCKGSAVEILQAGSYTTRCEVDVFTLQTNYPLADEDEPDGDSGRVDVLYGLNPQGLATLYNGSGQEPPSGFEILKAVERGARTVLQRALQDLDNADPRGHDPKEMSDFASYDRLSPQERLVFHAELDAALAAHLDPQFPGLFTRVAYSVRTPGR